MATQFGARSGAPSGAPSGARLSRRRFLVGATAAVTIAVAVDRTVLPRVADATEVAPTAATDHIVNGSFEDGPTGSTIPGWTATRPPA